MQGSESKVSMMALDMTMNFSVGQIFDTDNLDHVRQAMRLAGIKHRVELSTGRGTDIRDKPGCRKLNMICTRRDLSAKI